MKGDWKLSGLNLTTPLQQPDGSSTIYVYPEVDPRLPPQIQWKLDYLGMLFLRIMWIKADDQRPSTLWTLP